MSWLGEFGSGQVNSAGRREGGGTMAGRQGVPTGAMERSQQIGGRVSTVR